METRSTADSTQSYSYWSSTRCCRWRCCCFSRRTIDCIQVSHCRPDRSALQRPSFTIVVYACLSLCWGALGLVRQRGRSVCDWECQGGVCACAAGIIQFTGRWFRPKLLWPSGLSVHCMRHTGQFIHWLNKLMRTLSNCSPNDHPARSETSKLIISTFSLVAYLLRQSHENSHYPAFTILAAAFYGIR